MIYQFKKMTSPAKTEEVTPTSSNISAAKFQRTSKKQITTPEQTNANSQKTESILTQEVKQTPLTDRPKIISRSNKVIQKTESSISIKNEQTQARKMVKSRSPVQLSQVIQSQQPKISVNRLQKSNVADLKPTNNTESEDFKPNPLKKSAALLYTIGRLRKNIISSSFLRLLQNKNSQRLKCEAQAKLLLLRASEIPVKFQLNYYQQFVQKLKVFYSKKVQQSSKTDLQTLSNNLKKIKQTLVSFLNIASKRKVKQALDLMKISDNKKQNAIKAVPTLSGFIQRRKIREAFQSIKMNSNLVSLRKKRLLGALSNITLSLQKELTKKGFIKLALEASSKTYSSKKEPQIQKKVKNTSTIAVNLANNRDQLSSKIQKINSQKQKHQSQISTLQNKLKKIKKEHQTEKKSLEKNLQQLKAENKKFQMQVQQKKQANKSLKTQESEPNDVKSELNVENEDTTAFEKFIKLQKLHFTLSRVQNQDINPHLSIILQENKIDTNKTAKIVQQWQLVLEKSALQSQINRYQSVIVGESGFIKQQNSIGKLVEEENEMLKTMIKNYIKQRYLWCQVQKFVSSMI